MPMKERGRSLRPPRRRHQRGGSVLSLINSEEAAKRLARVILSDIELYNKRKIQAKADMKPELEEGYNLFRSRVAPELVPLFSEAVAARWPGAGAKPAPVMEPPRPAPPPARPSP